MECDSVVDGPFVPLYRARLSSSMELSFSHPVFVSLYFALLLHWLLSYSNISLFSFFFFSSEKFNVNTIMIKIRLESQLGERGTWAQLKMILG